jgi:PAS domain-containing protein
VTRSDGCPKECDGWFVPIYAGSGQSARDAFGVTALLAFALVVALALWLGRIIARSVGHAARAAIALGEGGPLSLRGTPIAEVNTLMAELREAAARRQASDDLLRESAATFRAMFDISSVGKVEVEPESARFMRANAAMCKFVGYSEAELLGRTVFDITHPDDRDRDREIVSTAGRRQVRRFRRGKALHP